MNSFKLISKVLKEQEGQPAPQDWTKDPTINNVVDFLMENPNPNDDQVHQFAEASGIDVHKLESIFYFLATKLAKVLREGRSNDKNLKEEDVDPKELAMGIKVELEHSSCPILAKKISLDHLSEIEDYYTRLKKMEKEAGIND